MGFSGKEGKGAREGAPPPQAQSELGGGPAPPFLPPSFLFSPWARLLLLAGPLLPSFIYGGGGHPIDTTIDPLDLLAVCAAPSTIHLDNIVVVLRRSPPSVEHHHRHHAVVLTELSLKARLDRSSRNRVERVLNSEVP